QVWWDQCLAPPQTKVQHTTAVKRFIGWAGAQGTVKLTRKKAGEYINHLLTTDELPKLSRRTVERHASSLSSLWRWYIARGMTEDNPWRGHGLSSKKLKKQNKRKALPDEALKALLSTVYGTGIYPHLHPDLVHLP